MNTEGQPRILSYDLPMYEIPESDQTTNPPFDADRPAYEYVEGSVNPE